jgi:hypothetical protein
VDSHAHFGQAGEEQSVIVDLRLMGGDFGSDAERQKVFELEDKLIAAIDAQDIGEYDGNEFGEGGVTLYAYGPDADALSRLRAATTLSWFLKWNGAGDGNRTRVLSLGS